MDTSRLAKQIACPAAADLSFEDLRPRISHTIYAPLLVHRCLGNPRRAARISQLHATIHHHIIGNVSDQSDGSLFALLSFMCSGFQELPATTHGHFTSHVHALCPIWLNPSPEANPIFRPAESLANQTLASNNFRSSYSCRPSTPDVSEQTPP